MRAALMEAFGEPTEVLQLVDVPEPTGPAAGEVLVGVEPLALSPGSRWTRSSFSSFRNGGLTCRRS